MNFSDVRFNFWAELESQENSSNKIHNYFNELEIPYTPEMVYLFLMNLN